MLRGRCSGKLLPGWPGRGRRKPRKEQQSPVCGRSYAPSSANFSGKFGAGEGNRTLVVSLGSFCSTIELHPHFKHLVAHLAVSQRRVLVLSLIAGCNLHDSVRPSTWIVCPALRRLSVPRSLRER